MAPQPNQDKILVFFSEGHWREPDLGKIGLKGWLRLIRRRPRIVYHVWIHWLVRFLSRSRIGHVAVAYRGAVLSPTIIGNQYWPVQRYAVEHPNLIAIIEVPAPLPVDLDDFVQGAKSAWPTFMRWLTRGFWPSQTGDCVAVTCRILAMNDVQVPRGTTTPQHLFTYLCRKGYKVVIVSE